MRRLALVLALALAACTRSTEPPALATLSLKGEFVVSCALSNRLADDPIVKPGQPGASHSHDFFGAIGTNANSTEATMRAAGTTCVNTPGDTAGYWVPTAYQPSGEPLVMERARVYYRSAGVPVSLVKPFPPGLKMIAGDPMAMEPQPLSVASWACTVVGGGPAGDEEEVRRLPVCPSSSPSVRFKLVFPNCWDGLNLDTPNHRDHMRYSSSSYGTANRCPAGWVAVPRLTIGVRYPFKNGFTRREGPNVTFAPMPGMTPSHYTGHGDMWNTWDQASLERLVAACINTGKSCGDSGGPR